MGGPDIFVDAGSTINLTCVASFTPGPPQYVKWLHFTQVPRSIPSLYSGYSSIRQVVTFYSGTKIHYILVLQVLQYVRRLHFTQVPRYIPSLYSGYSYTSSGYTLLRYLDTFHPCTPGTPIRQVVTLYSGNQDTVHPCTPGPPQYVRWLYFTQVPRCIPSLYSGSSSIRQVVRFYSVT